MNESKSMQIMNFIMKNQLIWTEQDICIWDAQAEEQIEAKLAELFTLPSENETQGERK